MRIAQTNISPKNNRQEPVPVQNKQKTLSGKIVDLISDHSTSFLILGCTTITAIAVFYLSRLPCQCPACPSSEPLEQDPLAPNCSVNQMANFDYARCNLKDAYVEIGKKGSGNAFGFVSSLLECYDCNRNDVREILNLYVDDELKADTANSDRRIINLAESCQTRSSCDQVLPKIFEVLMQKNYLADAIQIVQKCVDTNSAGCSKVIQMAPDLAKDSHDLGRLSLNDKVRNVFNPDISAYYLPT